MDFSDYQRLCANTAVYPGTNTGSKEAITYVALKLAGEAGEVAEKIGKYLYRGDALPEGTTLIDIVKKELGDVQWYLTRMCSELDLTLEEVAEANIDKLTDRAKRGVLKGSGDDR